MIIDSIKINNITGKNNGIYQFINYKQYVN